MSVTEILEANPRRNRDEAARYCGVSANTLASWAVSGEGPAFIKAGRKVVYLQSDLDAWMASRRVARS